MKEKQIRIKDLLISFIIHLFTIITVLLVLSIITYITYQGLKHFNINMLISETSILNKTIGLLPNIINTLYMIIITLIISVPISISGALYLNEYAKNKHFINIITITIEVLAGIPSIIYGLFGMLLFGQVMKLSYSLLSGALTLSIMVLPILLKNTLNALETIPHSYREGALGLGTPKWYMIKTILIPASLPGILTGVILSIGRIIAESAALLFTAGSLNVLPENIVTHIFSSGGTLTIQLYLEMAKANYDIAFVIGMILIVIILLLNYLAKNITQRLSVR